MRAYISLCTVLVIACSLYQCNNQCFVPTPQIADMSLQVSSVREEVSHALLEVENGQVSPINTDSSKILTKGEAVLSLLEYVNGLQFVKAVQLLRSFR